VDLSVSRGDAPVSWYTSRIVEHVLQSSKELLVVEWPLEKHVLVNLESGQRVSATISRPDDALYVVDAEVVAVTLERLPCVTLECATEWRRAQRRAFVRLPSLMSPQVTKRVGQEAPAPVRAIIANLSAGGVLVRSADALDVHDELEVCCSLTSEEVDADLDVKLEVVRVATLDHDSLWRWEAGCRFVNPSVAQREQVVRWTFIQQRALAKRTRGAESK
jgi:c-di-GMP-binding flagellar brake protein YcgR